MSARVKKLVWPDPQFNQIVITPLGAYTIRENDKGRWLAVFDKGWGCREGISWKGSIAEAQSACQSHYEKAVMALLEDEK